MADRKPKQPDPKPSDKPVIPTKQRVPVEQARLGLDEQAYQALREAMRPATIPSDAVIRAAQEAMRPSREAVKALAEAASAPSALIAELQKSSERLAQFQAASYIAPEIKPIPKSPPPEVTISRVLREEIGALAEITQAVNTQMAAILTIASQVVPALTDYSDTTRRHSRVVIGLSVVLVVLTAAIAYLTWLLIQRGG
jgi:hypothetical protein